MKARVSAWLAAPQLLGLVLTIAATPGLAAAQNLEFEPVGTIPGPAQLIAAHDGRAYVSARNTLNIFDVSDPASPLRLGTYEFPNRIFGFRVIDSLVYVAAGVFGLGVLDVSDAGAVRLLGSFKTPGQAKSVAVSSTTALVVDHLEGIVVVDISNPARPAEVGSVFLEGFATDVLISGSLAYAMDRPTGLYVLDLSNPNAVELVTSSQSTNALFPFQAQLALARPEDGPPLLVVLALRSGPTRSWVDTRHGHLTLQLYDISEPTEPVKLPPYAPPGGVLRASFRGSLAYVTGPGGLFVVDLSTPASPRIVGRHQTRSFDVAVDGSLVFLTAPREGVVILRQNP